MNGTTKLLKDIFRCKIRLKKLNDKMLDLALKYASGEDFGETYTQCITLAEMSFERERLQDVILQVSQILSRMPLCYAALLDTVYGKNTHPRVIARRYNVSCAQVYSKLRLARKCFFRRLGDLRDFPLDFGGRD